MRGRARKAAQRRIVSSSAMVHRIGADGVSVVKAQQLERATSTGSLGRRSA